MNHAGTLTNAGERDKSIWRNHDLRQGLGLNVRGHNRFCCIEPGIVR